jgi:hypothetical protein
MRFGEAEAKVEGLENRVAARSRESGHVESPADRGPAAGDVALAFARSAIVVERSQASEGGDFGIGELTQLREMGQEGGGGAGADALEGLQASGFGGGFRRGLQESGDLGDGFFELFLEMSDRSFEIAHDGLGQPWDEPGDFGIEHGLPLIPA